MEHVWWLKPEQGLKVNLASHETVYVLKCKHLHISNCDTHGWGHGHRKRRIDATPQKQFGGDVCPDSRHLHAFIPTSIPHIFKTEIYWKKLPKSNEFSDFGGGWPHCRLIRPPAKRSVTTPLVEINSRDQGSGLPWRRQGFITVLDEFIWACRHSWPGLMRRIWRKRLSAIWAVFL